MPYHAQGPWKWTGLFVEDRSGKVIADVRQDGGRTEGNGLLLAAAPELLAACKQAAELFENDEGIAQVLMRAIAKAAER